MLRRIAHIFGFFKKDEALEKRFAKIKAHYLEAQPTDELTSPLSHIRMSGNFDKRSVIGASTVTKERMTQTLLESCARAVEKESDLAGTGAK